MNIKLLSLELRKCSIKPYVIAMIASSIIMICFIYLMTAVPRIDVNDSDVELLSSYSFVIGLTLVVSMGIFSIMSAVMSARFIVDEYVGKRAILILSYPIKRAEMIMTKATLVFLLTLTSMVLCGGIALSMFMITESLFKLGSDSIDTHLIESSILYLLGYSIIASCCGVISGGIGLKRSSAISAIVSACILVVVICQIAGMTLFASELLIAVLLLMIIATVWTCHRMIHIVDNMEI